MAVPQSGEPVYVGEGQIVRMYTASGKFIRAWKNGPAGPFSWPSVTAAPGGVIVGNGPAHPSVMRFAADEGSLSASDWFTPKPPEDDAWFRGCRRFTRRNSRGPATRS